MNSTLPLSMLAGINRLDHTLEGWTLVGENQEERRKFIAEISFEREFAAPPVVHLGIVGFDISNQDASRLSVRPEGIHPGGFSIVAETWMGSQVYSIDVSWMALGT